MNFAYLILAHKNPDQLIRLIRRLQDKGSSFFIHLDRKSGEEIYSQLVEGLKDVPNLYFVKRCRCYWGAFNIVKATLKLIDRLIESEVDFDYAFLLSGQDYLIKTPTEIRDYISRNRGKEFIESFPLQKPNRWSEMGGEYQALNRVQYWHFRVRSRHIYWQRKREFPKEFTPYGGSQWWCLSKQCLEYIHKFTQKHPLFVNYYKYVFIPDESFFQTIIANSSFKNYIFNDDLRFVDWDNPNPTPPTVLDNSYFERLQNSPKLFARKFDINRYPDILDKIDREILELPALKN